MSPLQVVNVPPGTFLSPDPLDRYRQHPHVLCLPVVVHPVQEDVCAGSCGYLSVYRELVVQFCALTYGSRLYGACVTGAGGLRASMTSTLFTVSSLSGGGDIGVGGPRLPRYFEAMDKTERLNIRLPLTKNSSREEVAAVFDMAERPEDLEGVFEGELPEWFSEVYGSAY